MLFNQVLPRMKTGLAIYRKSWIDHFAFTVRWLELRSPAFGSEVNEPYLLRKRSKYGNATGQVSSGHYTLSLEDILAEDWEFSNICPSNLSVDDLLNGCSLGTEN